MKLNVKYLLLLGLAWVFTAGTCDKDCNNSVRNYEFVLPVTLTPAIDTFRIGDTIKIVAEFSNSVYDRANDRFFLLDSFRFYPTTRIIRIDTTTGTDSFDDFEIIIPMKFDYERFDGSRGSQTLFGQYTYTQEGEYILNYKIIPLKKGVYLFRHASSVSSYESEQDFPGRCELNGSYGISVLNDNIDNNIELLEDSPDPHFSEWILEKPEKRFYKHGSYAFVVVE